MIMPYLGYGTLSRVRLCGRMLADEGLRPARDADRRWRNLVAFYRRLESDEVPGAWLRAALGSRQAEAITNREGYFAISLEGLSLRAGWHDVHLHLARKPEVQAVGRVLVPSARARFGRRPFKGVAAFYRALHAGVNPVFYVSKSPWNLYAPLVEFLELQGLPAGPLVLRDFGLRMKKHPKLPFVLIGDSGERDPEIYADIVKRFPGRVRALAPDSEFAAAHAAAEGLIQPSDLRGIRSDRKSDERSGSKPPASSGALK